MKLNAKRILSMLLCLCFCMGMAVPASAANESNTEGFVFSASLDNPTLYVSDQPQTVVMTIVSNKEMTLQGIGGQIIWSEGLTLTGINNSHAKIDYTGSINLANGKIAWQSNGLETLTDVMTIAVATFTVPANTPAGTYAVGIKDIELCKDNFRTIWESTATATATLTIEATPTTQGYTAGISTMSQEVRVGEQVGINVNVSHSADTVFAAGEVVVSYDSAKLTFNENASTLGQAKVKVDDGVVTIEDHGADKNLGNGVYVLKFDAVASGAAEVKLDGAAFSNKENAADADLVPAILSPATVTVTVQKKDFQVTLPEGMTGPATAVDGESYTFWVEDENYTYTDVKAEVDGVEVPLTQNPDGSYTVETVTGNLVITANVTPKSYTVTITGETKGEPGKTATYGEPYQFTLADDIAPSTTAGTTYTLTSVKIGGAEYKGYTAENRTYTIPGNAITGDIEIIITATSLDANKFTAEITGDGIGNASLDKTVVDKGGTVTMTLTPEAGYSYEVTATMGGNSATVTKGENNTYTVSNVSGNVVFTVTKTLVTDGVDVTEYITLNETSMWLVKFDATLAEGKVPTYDGNNMFWSTKYNAYCYLVIAADLQTEAAKAEVGVTDGEAVFVNYEMDVNITGKVDANDAQLVYNMYQALYTEFTAELTVEKFLRADLNGDGTVYVNDATTIITEILK